MTLATTVTSADPADDTPKWVAGALATLRARLWLVALVAALSLVAAIIYLRVADYTYTVAPDVLVTVPIPARKAVVVAAPDLDEAHATLE